MSDLTHFNKDGAARMVDVSNKQETKRTAVAQGKIIMQEETLNLIKDGRIEKGDVLNVARVAGVMAVKKTPDLIPMCHHLLISGVEIDFSFLKQEVGVRIKATVKNTGQTGVEMEALTAVSTTALTIYDMCKAVDKGMEIGGVKLLKKTGGKSGDYLDQSLQGQVVAYCTSGEKGTSKSQVGSVEIETDHGIKGDAHAGMESRQISLLALEDIESMRQQGLELQLGAFAENIVTSGIDLSTLEVGDKLAIDEKIILEITQLGKKCHDRCEIYHQAGDCIMPKRGIFARVLAGGKSSKGAKIEVVAGD